MADGGDTSPPLTFADLGIKTETKTQNTVLGQTRRLSDLQTTEWLFLVIVGLALPSLLGFTIYRLVVSPAGSEDLVFAILLLINTLFCFYYVIHGVFRERPYELFVLVIATVIITIYTIVNYAVGTYDLVKLIRLVIACALGPFLVGLGLYICREYYLSGNLIFRTIGANTELQSMCKMMFFFFAILKFDLQLAASMVVLILSTSAVVDTEDIVVLSVGGAISLVWFLIGFFSVRKEDKALSWIFIALSPLEPAYIVYKVIRSVQNDRADINDLLPTITYVCAALALFIRVSLMITKYFTYRNFNKGLKERAYGSADTSDITPITHDTDTEAARDT